jgi:hypothetical protein
LSAHRLHGVGILRRALIIPSLLLGVPGLAHHSNAMYDQDKTVTLRGKVKEFQWTNPHCWIELVVAAAPGGEVWSIQMGPPGNLYRDGWRPSALHIGDELLIQVHPIRDRSRGGIWVSGTRADGTPIASHAAK